MSNGKRTTMTVVFTASEDEQALLAAAEEVLTEGEFSSFSQLCKEALRRYVEASDTAPTGADGSAAQMGEQLDAMARMLDTLLTVQREWQAEMRRHAEEETTTQQVASIEQSLQEVLATQHTLQADFHAQLAALHTEVQRMRTEVLAPRGEQRPYPPPEDRADWTADETTDERIETEVIASLAPFLEEF